MLTVPTMRRGSVLPMLMSVELVTGPQPPPPAASTNPPKSPRMVSERREAGGCVLVVVRRPRENRMMRLRPMRSRMVEVTGLAALRVRLLSTVAPRKAPAAPGMPSCRATFQSTLPNFQWLSPEAAVVPSSATCTTAEALAGVMVARVMSRVVEVAPNPIPRLPSTSWAIAPPRVISSSVRMVLLSWVCRGSAFRGWVG